MTFRSFQRCAAALAVCFACWLCAGCQLLGVAASRASSDTVKARYVPNKQDPMLVLVESYGLMLESPIEAEHMTLTLNKTLADHKVAPLIDQEALEKLKDSSQDYDSMSIVDIGRRLGAKQILYVYISRAELDKPVGSGQVRGHMEAKVKIVDCQTADCRWPADAPSEFTQITTPWVPRTSDAVDNDVRVQMSDQMARDIGRFFHDYTADDKATEPPAEASETMSSE